MTPVTLSADSELELLDRAARGDRSALEALYVRTRDRLLTVFHYLCGDDATADDLVHEVYLKLWEGRNRIAVKERPMAYLCAMGRNLWQNQQRRKAILRRIQESTVPKRAVEEDDRKQIVERAIQELVPDVREVFTLHRHGGMSYAEIAHALEISVKTVEARMKRAFDELRRILRPQLESEAL